MYYYVYNTQGWRNIIHRDQKETANINTDNISILNQLPTLGTSKNSKRYLYISCIFKWYSLIKCILDKEKTAISIANRKKVSGLVPFEKLDVQTKHLEMLNWFVNKNVASIGVSGNGLKSEAVIENIRKNIHCAVLNSYFAIDDLYKSILTTMAGLL